MDTKTKLLIVHHRHEQYRQAIESRTDAFEIVNFDFRDPVPFETSEAEILIGWKFQEGLIERLPKLKWIAAPAAGVDNILKALPANNLVLITRAQATMPKFMAEYCIQHMLNHMKNYEIVRKQHQKEEWRHVKSDLLSRRTLGLLGLGSIGTKIATTAKSLGMRVLAAKRNAIVSPAQKEACDEIFTGDHWRDMLPEVDFLVLILPDTEESRHMIGAKELASMKNSAVLINIARGAIVNEADLVDALRKNIIAGAVLDVFEEEPLPSDHPFWTMENVIVTPHCAGPSEEEAIVEEFLQNYERWSKGGIPDRVVNINSGY